MAKSNSFSAYPISSAVKSKLIELAFNNLSRERLCNHLADVEDGVLAYILELPLFVPNINEICICRGSRNICIVSNVNIKNSRCTVTYAAKEVKYFKTAEMAQNYQNGEKIDYDEWQWHEGDAFQVKGEKMVAHTTDYDLTDIEPLNYDGQIEHDFEQELFVIREKMEG